MNEYDRIYRSPFSKMSASAIKRIYFGGLHPPRLMISDTLQLSTIDFYPPMASWDSKVSNGCTEGHLGILLSCPFQVSSLHSMANLGMSSLEKLYTF